MNAIENISRSCPYCGEPIDLQIDCSVANQEYIEDCQVCCKPMQVSVDVASSDGPVVEVRQEND